jgi:hypothetical protein
MAAVRELLRLSPYELMLLKSFRRGRGQLGNQEDRDRQPLEASNKELSMMTVPDCEDVIFLTNCEICGTVKA